MTDKLYKCAGLVTKKGKTKVHYGNDMTQRVWGYSRDTTVTRCDFTELPTAMNKEDALRFLLSYQQFSSYDDQTLIQEQLSKYERAMIIDGRRVLLTTGQSTTTNDLITA
jgi:hypothetical protein